MEVQHVHVPGQQGSTAPTKSSHAMKTHYSDGRGAKSWGERNVVERVKDFGLLIVKNGDQRPDKFR